MGPHGDGTAHRLARAGVTEREAEVLSAVSERLRNREIAARLHLSVRTVESHIAALLRKLGVDDRAALVELGTQLRQTAAGRSALPVPLTSLVGRESETNEVAAAVEEHRLVTLVGPGGVGKTRLALRFATVNADRFPDGARIADLAPVGPELVEDTMARAIGVVPQPGWPLRDVLREVVGGMRGLLIVDNCEHVVAEAAEIVADLLGAGSRLRVLATSREPLGVAGELTYWVRTLAVPPPHDAGRAAIGAYDAVRLFVDRAAAASPGFVLTDAVAPAVSALCARLDGLPLAIELAASRVHSFGPVGLVEHLDRRFELLSAGVRTAPPRHRTLRGAIDWSYGLLDDEERELFDRLGVFPADFDFAAAQAVAGTGCAAELGVITVLPRLVDKSLVSSGGLGIRRYRMLETIRAYAAERLADSGAGPAARDRLAGHYLAVAEHCAAQLRGAEQGVALARLITEQPNLRAALTHVVAIGDVESAWRWVAALQRFWDATGQRREAHTWIHAALAIGDPLATPETVAGLASASTILQAWASRAAFDLAQRAARLAAGLDDLSRARAARAVAMGAMWVRPELVLPALHDALAGFGDRDPWERGLTMQCLTQATGDVAAALRWGRQSVALFRGVGDDMFAANTLFIMAQRSIYAGIGDDEVHDWLTESRALADATGSEEDQAHATIGFGQLAWLRGDHDGAARMVEECLPTLRRLGDQRCTGRALYMLGERAYERRQLDRAEQLLGACVEAIALAGQSFVLVNALESLAAVHLAQGHPYRAAVLLGTAHAALRSASAHMRPVQSLGEQLRRSLERALGTRAFEIAHGEGENLPPARALLYTPADEGG